MNETTQGTGGLEVFPNEQTIYVARAADSPSSTGSLIYNSIYRELGLNALYLQFSGIKPGDLASSLRLLSFRGCTVVGENAQAVIPFLDALDAHAESVGAVNTIVNESGILTGYKTDGPALLDALSEASDIKGKNIVVLGAGKLVKEMAIVLRGGGVGSVTLYNRTADRGSARCQETGFDYGGGIGDLIDVAAGDIFINASDVGAAWCSSSDIFAESFVDRFDVVMDVTFRPIWTPLQDRAAKLGKVVVPGVKMFALQGRRQVSLYFGCEPSVERLCELISEEFGGG